MTADKELAAWVKRTTEGITGSAAFVQLYNQKMKDDPLSDPTPLIQMAAAIYMDKPVILLVPDGAEIPPKLLRVADAIEFFHPGDTSSLHQATVRALRTVGMGQEAKR